MQATDDTDSQLSFMTAKDDTDSQLSFMTAKDILSPVQVDIKNLTSDQLKEFLSNDDILKNLSEKQIQAIPMNELDKETLNKVLDVNLKMNRLGKLSEKQIQAIPMNELYQTNFYTLTASKLIRTLSTKQIQSINCFYLAPHSNALGLINTGIVKIIYERGDELTVQQAQHLDTSKLNYNIMSKFLHHHAANLSLDQVKTINLSNAKLAPQTVNALIDVVCRQCYKEAQGANENEKLQTFQANMKKYNLTAKFKIDENAIKEAFNQLNSKGKFTAQLDARSNIEQNNCCSIF